MATVLVRLKQNAGLSYPIIIKRGIFSGLAADLKKRKLGDKYAIIADSRTAGLYGKRLLAKMRSLGMDAKLLTFKAGERSKILRTYAALLEKAYAAGLDRNGCIIALGGGVCGDLAGFVAATYMRGINYVQVPTTLLAMVDSSIGGKVAVNLRRGKNCCGAFYQPRCVYIDVGLLRSLPADEISSGLAEIVKHAAIKDASLFGYIERNSAKLLRKDPGAIEHLIAKSCAIKAGIVEADERELSEKGVRKLLNFGHTVAHALEALQSYKISHGKAVSIGMCAEADLGVGLGITSASAAARLRSLLSGLCLPTAMPKVPTAKLLALMRRDKKARHGSLEFVFPSRIGKVGMYNGHYARVVPAGVVAKAMKQGAKR